MELLAFLAGLVIGGAAIYHTGRKDRRDAERFRREIQADARAAVRAEPEYLADRIVLRNYGPGDAVDVRITDASCGPRSRVGDPRELYHWALPVDIPAGAEAVLRAVPREGVGSWMELSLEWTHTDGSPGSVTQRVDWAG